MAYDPDKMNKLNILESSRVFECDDRQAPYDEIYCSLITAGFGVTQVGDVLTVRKIGWDATLILHEVKLDRDHVRDHDDHPDNK